MFGHKCVFRDYYNRHEPGVWKHHTWVVVNRAHAAAIVRRGVQALDKYHSATRQAAPDWSLTTEGCSCEGAALVAIVSEFRETHPHETVGDYLSDLERMGVEQKCTTFVSWKNCFTGTKLNRDSILLWLGVVLLNWIFVFPVMYISGFDSVKARDDNVGNAFPRQFHSVSAEYLETLTQEGFLFARKFYTETMVDTDHGIVSLVKVLPALWNKVDEQLALNQMWSRVDKWGHPKSTDHPGTEELGLPTLMLWLAFLVILLMLTRISWARLIWPFGERRFERDMKSTTREKVA
jgi:hypothetical protein